MMHERQLKLVRVREQTIVVLKDPRGEPLNRLSGPPRGNRNIPAPRGCHIGQGWAHECSRGPGESTIIGSSVRLKNLEHGLDRELLVLAVEG